MQVQIKEDVLLPSRPEMLFVWTTAIATAQHMECDLLVLTGGKEGRHSRKSKHWSDLAMDLFVTKSRHTPGTLNQAFARELRAALPDFDVVFEDSPLHVHVEFDPVWGEIQVTKIKP